MEYLPAQYLHQVEENLNNSRLECHTGSKPDLRKYMKVFFCKNIPLSSAADWVIKIWDKDCKY